MNNTQVFLAQKDDDLPLVVDELVGILSLKRVDELDKVAVTVLAKVLGAQVYQMILALYVGNADLALLHQFLHEKKTQRDMLCARTVGTRAGDVQLRRVIDIQRQAAEALIEAQLQYYHVEEKHRLLHCSLFALTPLGVDALLDKGVDAPSDKGPRTSPGKDSAGAIRVARLLPALSSDANTSLPKEMACSARGVNGQGRVLHPSVAAVETGPNGRAPFSSTRALAGLVTG